MIGSFPCHRRRLRRQRAMTIVEVVIASALSSVVALGTFATLLFASRAIKSTAKFNKANQESHYLTDMIARDIRSAVGSAPSYFDGQTTYTASNNDTLILKVPSVDSNGTVIDPQAELDYVVYSPDSKNQSILRRQIYPGTQSSRPAESEAIGHGGFTIKPNAQGTYLIYYRLLKTESAMGSTVTMPVTGAVRLRNVDVPPENPS